MCNCPEPLPPPNEQIKKCRLILQALAAGLVVLCILAIIANSFFSIFMYLVLVFMLYLSWTQFNWCFALVFFLFSVTDFIQTTIIIIGMLQYNLFFSNNEIQLSIYLMVSFFYFTNAIYFSHYSYRHFKSLSNEGQNQFNIIPPVNPNGGAALNEDQYRRIEETPSSTRTNAVNKNNEGKYFEGQGVRIG